MFIQTGMTVFSAIFQLFLISLVASLLVRKKKISTSQVQALTYITVNILLPCLIIAKTLRNFHPAEFPNWWILPLSGILIIIIGLVFSAILFKFRSKKMPLMVLSSMQNAIYIVLPIGQILFVTQFDRFALYCFLLVLGVQPVMWSIGKVMLSGKEGQRIHWKDFITPPLLAIVISLTAVFTKVSVFIPGPVIESIDLLGQGTVPLAVFILGATIGSISFKEMPRLNDILVVSVVKFVLVPSMVFAVLCFGKVNMVMPLFGSLMMIQASSPPATNLILIVKNYGGDAQAISSMMLIQYIICIVAMPLWIAAWQYMVP